MAKGASPPPAEPTPNSTAAEPDAGLSKRLFEARLMLTYAAEAGKDLKEDVVAIVANAEDAHARGTWNVDTTKQFWSAYSKLSSIITPVTGESLVACAGEDVKRTVARGRWIAICLAVLIIPLSVTTFVNTSMLNDVTQRINDNNNSIITLRDQLNSLTNATTDQKPQIEREMAITLQQFTTTSRSLYQRALLLNRFVLNFQEADPLAAQYATEEARRKALELPVPIKDFPAVRNDHVALYQTIRGYTKDVQQLNLLFYGAITAYVLPVLYAILGAAAYTLRSLSQQLIARTYIPSYVDHARFPAAVIAGLVVGLFTNFTQSISLSPLAIAFLVGYGVEIFFSFLDAFLDTLKKVRSR